MGRRGGGGQLRSEMARDCPAFEPMWKERTEPKFSAVPTPRGHNVCHHSGAEGPPFGLMLCYQALEIHIILNKDPHVVILHWALQIAWRVLSQSTRLGLV